MEKNKGIRVLSALFMMFVSILLLETVRYKTTVHFAIYDSLGFGNVGFAIHIGFIVLYLFCLFVIKKPRESGFWIIIGSIIISMVENVATLFIAISKIEMVQKAYTLSREARNLHVTQEGLDMVVNPTTLMITSCVVLLLYLVMVMLVLRNRTHFSITYE